MISTAPGPSLTLYLPLTLCSFLVYPLFHFLFSFTEQFTHIDGLIRASIQHAYAPGTRSNHRTQWKAYLRFAQFHELDPVPAELSTILRFAQFLALSKLAVPTIKNYIAGVHTLHKYLGAPFPDLSAFFPALFFKGLSKLLPHFPHQALPITPQILLQIHSLLDLKHPFSLVLWTSFLVAFFTFARKANLLPPSTNKFDTTKHLTRGNISTCDSGLLVTFTFTKTLQAGGRSIQIPIASIPNSPLCPLLAFSSMTNLIPAPSSAPAFLIPTNSGPLSLTQPFFVSKLRVLLNHLKLPSLSYSGHSFRRGGASWAFESGVPGELIKLVGDWRSNAYLKYLEAPLHQKLLASQKMAKSIHQLPTS